MSLVIHIPLTKVKSENIRPIKIRITTRRPIPNQKLKINPSPLRETRNIKTPMIPETIEIRQIIKKMVLRWA